MILCCIANEELTVGDLNDRIDLSQSALSQHLSKLRQSKVVVTRRVSQTIYYRVENEDIKYLLKVLQDRFCENI